MAAIAFRNDDQGYLNWLEVNPNGFVLNGKRMADGRMTPSYVRVHRVGCRRMGGSYNAREGGYTGRSYAKVVAPTVDELLRWATRQGGLREADVRPCQACLGNDLSAHTTPVIPQALPPKRKEAETILPVPGASGAKPTPGPKMSKWKPLRLQQVPREARRMVKRAIRTSLASGKRVAVYAKEKDIDIEAMRREIPLLWEKQNGRCCRTGVPFDHGSYWLHASLDRIDSTKGYGSGNVQIVTWFYNWAKGTKTDERFIHLARLHVGAAA